MEQRLDILLVDDDQGDLELFRRAVTATGLHINVQTLSAGEQAIDYLEAKGDDGDRSLHPLPDLIVLDLKMPRVDGFVFLAWRRASSVFSSIPVIILSGLSAPAEVKLANELGANRHFVKPVAPNDWERIVREVWNSGKRGEGSLPISGSDSDPGCINWVGDSMAEMEPGERSFPSESLFHIATLLRQLYRTLV